DITMPVAATICMAMFCTVVIAKLVGCPLPLLAKRAHLDPAVMASPFITTIVDVLSLLVLFSLASSILRIAA
ncbi:MAG: magnesium transporter, partial [Clostridia bacterium]|nr:magnesium transporter [Clostridia bacterium]